MKKILTFTASLLLASLMFSCNSGSDNENEIAVLPVEEEGSGTETTPGTGKTLIVYYSRTGENYGVGTITVGNTAVMAGYIQDYTGAAVYEIVPEVPYPDDYDEMREISQQETAADARPAIKTPLDSLSKYDTIFVGSPIWYGAPPMIMRTFYEANDLSDKTIIPFGTHEGSGIGSCTTLLRSYFPNATYLESYGLRGQQVRDSRGAVEEWLGRIGVSRQTAESN